ncbi:MAG: lamin tail domain-containing protein [Deltaproteobacteria bacterium]|nr:lamin tail domain-containing protein [Deltaproteobacteria bacterium]
MRLRVLVSMAALSLAAIGCGSTNSATSSSSGSHTTGTHGASTTSTSSTHGSGSSGASTGTSESTSGSSGASSDSGSTGGSTTATTASTGSTAASTGGSSGASTNGASTGSDSGSTGATTATTTTSSSSSSTSTTSSTGSSASTTTAGSSGSTASASTSGSDSGSTGASTTTTGSSSSTTGTTASSSSGSTGTSDSGSTGSTGTTSSSGSSSGSTTGTTGTSGSNVSAQIATIRQAIHDASASPVTLSSLPITGGVVSYIKGDYASAGAGAAEGPGFFVQNDNSGPALFFAMDPTVIGLSVGDTVDVVATQGAWQSCSSSASNPNHCSADVSIYAVTGATVTKTGSGQALPTAQDLTNDTSFSAPIVTPVSNIGWVYDTELVTMRGVISGAFGSGGAGFQKATFSTLGSGAAGDLALRLPTSLLSTVGLYQGCDVTVSGVPMWRFGLDTEVTAWTANDLIINSCPALQVSSVTPADTATNVDVLTNLIVTFNAPMFPGSVGGQGAPGPCVGNIQVSADGFNTCAGLSGTALSSNNTVATLQFQPALSYGETYGVRVLGSVTGVQSLAGGSMSQDFNSSFTTVLPGPATCGSVATGALVISQIYGGGGNSGAQYKNDFIELHNRSNATIDLTGLSVEELGATVDGGWNITTPLAGSIGPGGYYLVAEGAGTQDAGALPTPDATGTIAIGASSGKAALINGTTKTPFGCPANALDLVAFGSGATCAENSENSTDGGAAAAPSNSTAIFRAGAGCTDTDDNAADFSVAAPAPRNSASPANVCSCAGSSTANETGSASEVGYCVLQAPATLSLAPGADSGLVYGRYYQNGLTPSASGAANVIAQVGFGPPSANPENQAGWTWSTTPAAFNAACHTDPGNPCQNNDEYMQSFTAPAATGTYAYTYRFSIDNGATWTYCDLDGAGSNSGLQFDVTQLPTLTVQ